MLVRFSIPFKRPMAAAAFPSFKLTGYAPLLNIRVFRTSFRIMKLTRVYFITELLCYKVNIYISCCN